MIFRLVNTRVLNNLTFLFFLYIAICLFIKEHESVKSVMMLGFCVDWTTGYSTNENDLVWQFVFQRNSG